MFKILCHCTLWLGVNFAAASWSHPDGPTRGQIPTSLVAATPQTTDRNWHAFWSHHLGRWNGSWTRNTPSGDINETFVSTRHFKAGKCEIVQATTTAMQRTFDRNRVVIQHQRSQSPGRLCSSNRSHAGDCSNNGAARLIPSLQPNQVAPFELFLIHGDRRHGVGGGLWANGRPTAHRLNPRTAGTNIQEWLE